MLSNSCRYGIRAVIYLAKLPRGSGMTGIRQISTDLGLPTPFLAKILQELAKKGILLSNKGPHGGFSLVKKPKSIKLIEIVRAIDGNEYFTGCIMHTGPCGGRKNNRKYCPLHEDYQKIRQDLTDLFAKKTIADLVESSEGSELIVI
jgi:Rrf2 family protein